MSADTMHKVTPCAPGTLKKILCKSKVQGRPYLFWRKTLIFNWGNFALASELRSGTDINFPIPSRKQSEEWTCIHPLLGRMHERFKPVNRRGWYNGCGWMHYLSPKSLLCVVLVVRTRDEEWESQQRETSQNWQREATYQRDEYQRRPREGVLHSLDAKGNLLCCIHKMPPISHCWYERGWRLLLEAALLGVPIHHCSESTQPVIHT